MRRRELLGSAGLVFASVVTGCLGNEDDPGERTNGDPETGKNGSSGDFERYVSITDIDGVPESASVEFDVQVTDGTVTTDGTGSLEAGVTNTSDVGRQVRTPYYKGASDGDPGILLYSLEAPDSPSKDYTPDCIEDPAPSQEFTEWTDEGPLMYTLEPGETATDELIVVDDPSVEGCLPPGEYRFETRHSIDDSEFTWGFTVEIADDRSDGTDDPGNVEDRCYDECSREVIPYEQFPEDVRTEIDAALDGAYEADRVYLREAMDLDESYVSVDDDYYEPTVTVEGDREVLQLHLVEPKALPNARPVSVEHDRDGERTITVEVVADDGTTLIGERRDLWPGGEVEFGSTSRVGTHELRITVRNGDEIEDEATESIRIDDAHFEVLVVVGVDEIFVTGSVAELGSCQYDA